MSAPLNDETESDYGSELDFTDEAILAQLDGPTSESNVIKQTRSLDNNTTGTDGNGAAVNIDMEELAGMSTDKLAEVLKGIEVVPIEEDKRSLWERYRKRRGWGALSVSDFAGPTWCEYQHTYRLASKSWLPPLERPATITTSKGLELVVDKKKTVKREKVLVDGTKVHSKIEKQVMGDIQQVKVETEGKESWWALRILNTIVSLSILIERGRVREVPVVGFVKDKVVFGVIDEIERREIAIPPPAPPSRSSNSSKSASQSGTSKSNQPRTPQKGKPSGSKSRSTPAPAKPEKKNDQSSLLQFFSPTTSKHSSSKETSVVNGKGKEKEKEINLDSEDLFMDLTQTDDEADLAALAEAEELERLRQEFEASDTPKSRWGYIISDTKTRFNRSLPPEPETISSRLQLMLYHRLFTSLLQPEPPPDTSPSSPPVHLGDPRALVPTGPFLWSKLYSKFNLDSTASLPEAFLSTIKPVIEGSELEELVGEAKTLAEFVFALVKVGELLRSEGQQEEILEKELEISYVLRQEDGRGNDWKGRRSAKKRGGQQSNKNAEESLGRDERADLEAAIALSLQDQTTQGQPDRTFDNKFVPTVEVKPKLISIAQDSLEPDDSDSQLPFLANPSLPLPFTLPPPLSQSSAHDEDDLAAPFSLPTNSQLNGRDEETTPAVAFDQSRRGRYNVRPRNLNTTTPTAALVSTEPGSSSNVRKRSRSPSPAASPTTAPPSRRSSTTSPPTLIGVTRFPLSLSLLSSHLARSLSYWNGERQPEGVSIENVKRCRTCEFEEGCEWRAGKAKEMEQAARERKRAREASGGSREEAPSGDLGRRSSDG